MHDSISVVHNPTEPQFYVLGPASHRASTSTPKVFYGIMSLTNPEDALDISQLLVIQ
jgi:hypothetical protein